MFKRLTVWIALVAILGMLGSANAALVGHWKLDDAGAVAVDSSGNGNDGTLQGAPAWVPGQLGGALEVYGSDWVDCGNVLDFGGAITIACWVNPTTATGIQGFAARSGAYALKSNGTRIQFTTPGVMDHFGVDFVLEAGTWQHVAASFQPSQDEGLIFYHNGVETDRISSSAINAASGAFLIASNQWGENLTGAIDDVRVYDHILTPEEVVEAMLGGAPELPRNPSPKSETTDVPLDTVLTWFPGAYAATHDVYFGTEFDDVNDASRTNPMGVLVSESQTEASYAPASELQFEQTYYWRIDEVNGPTDYTVFKGEVWSFTTEPVAYAVENITATSNVNSAPGQGPEHLVDGSGLDGDGHSNDTDDMWAAPPSTAEPTQLLFEFDRLYKLNEMLIWNYNMEFEIALGIGVKDATIEYSEDGIAWNNLGDIVLDQASGRDGLTYGTVVPFEGVAARYVRLTVGSSWSAAAIMNGLSEVRFLYIPAYAREPKPANQAVDVTADTTLSWRAGRGATSHEVYLGTDPNALALAGTTTQSRFSPVPLDLDATYYWQVVELSDGGAWAGDIWAFSTEAYVEIDGFEAYDDEVEAGTTIWQTWLDSYEDASNGGSFVGNDPSPFAELTIVHSGSQSMPLYYANDSASAISETDRVFATPQDWTASGIKSLSLWFRGIEGNTGRLYAKINDVKILYESSAEDIATTLWLPWNIDLSTVGANLSAVESMSIGVEGAGSGIVYIDDVRLYPKAAVYGVPAQPGTTNLAAYYKLDGNANDSSGNGFNGVANGGPTYADGFLGQAVSLDGTDDYIRIETVGIDPCEPRTMAGWVRATTTAAVSGWTDVFGFTGPSETWGHFDIQCVLDTDYTTLGYYGLHRYGWERDIIPIDLEWHHLAASYDGEIVALYGDGQCVGVFEAEPAEVAPPGQFHMGKREDNSNFFRGLIDEVRVYDLALTPGEIAGLAGRTTTTQVPF